MSVFALCLMFVCPVLLLLVALRYLRLHNLKMTAMFVLLALSVGAVGGITGYGEMENSAKHSTESNYARDQRENQTRRYEQALEILVHLDFNHPDREKSEEAVRLLQDFADKDLASQLEGSCPDAQMLLAYAEAMNQVALYRGHMTNKDVAADRKLLSIVQDMPEGYQGRLSEKILPFQRLIVAMCKEAEHETRLDKENAQKHAANLSQGKYGGIHPGDSETKIAAAMGKPSRVNVTNGEGAELKQYVFNHNGKSVYVYTRDGVVTDVSM